MGYYDDATQNQQQYTDAFEYKAAPQQYGRGVRDITDSDNLIIASNHPLHSSHFAGGSAQNLHSSSTTPSGVKYYVSCILCARIKIKIFTEHSVQCQQIQ